MLRGIAAGRTERGGATGCGQQNAGLDASNPAFRLLSGGAHLQRARMA